MTKTYLSVLILLILSSFGNTFAQSAYQPDLSLKLETFEKQVLSEKDEVWVLDFWASWCRPCIEAMPHMKELYHKYQGKKVRFIGISWDKNPNKWMFALNRLQIEWQQIIVPKGSEDFLNKNFPHRGIPTAFVISRNGKVKRVNDVYALEKIIDKALR
ncbi:MAG TPA: TlpA family protein disulfide reductase [Bacteroidetes bacterium]|nr:TlpA family protein disulfide reductase [Bacteroidota bacterium]